LNAEVAKVTQRARRGKRGGFLTRRSRRARRWRCGGGRRVDWDVEGAEEGGGAVLGGGVEVLEDGAALGAGEEEGEGVGEGFGVRGWGGHGVLLEEVLNAEVAEITQRARRGMGMEEETERRRDGETERRRDGETERGREEERKRLEEVVEGGALTPALSHRPPRREREGGMRKVGRSSCRGRRRGGW
jgi:hypothetical protein